MGDGVLWKSGPAEGVPGSLQTGGVYEVGGEIPGTSLNGIILDGPLTLPRLWFPRRSFLLRQVGNF
jgi:hypothetical protein